MCIKNTKQHSSHLRSLLATNQQSVKLVTTMRIGHDRIIAVKVFTDYIYNIVTFTHSDNFTCLGQLDR